MKSYTESLAGEMMGCAVAVNRVAEQLARIYGVSAREVLAVVELVLDGPCNASDLAARMTMSRSAMTALLRRMTVDGWVEVHPDPNDRRALAVRASNRSVAMLQTLEGWFEHGLRSRAASSTVDSVRPALRACTGELAAFREWLKVLGPSEVRTLTTWRGDGWDAPVV